MTDPSDIPTPLPWEERYKSVQAMPGGLFNYINSLEDICKQIAKHRPSALTIRTWLQTNFYLTEKGADERLKFLRRSGIIENNFNQCDLTDTANRWHQTGDDGILIALLHSRTKYLGEMLAELGTGSNTLDELNKSANTYGLKWDSLNQVNLRRGWLQSAKLIEAVNGDALSITDAGYDLLTDLQLHQPSTPSPLSQPLSTPTTTPSAHLGSRKFGGRKYISPTQQEVVKARKVFEFNSNRLNQGIRAHIKVQEKLAKAVESAGLVPLSPASHDPKFDVAWRKDNSVFVVEVKSVTKENEERQLRLGLGQVLSYAFLLNWHRVDKVHAVLALKRKPSENYCYWEELCRQHGVILTWPDRFKQLFE